MCQYSRRCNIPTWQGFPVLVVGTTDRNKSFHPIGIAVCENEKTDDFSFMFKAIQIGLEKIQQQQLTPKALVADASKAIKNGFQKIFIDNYADITCWFHMKKAIKDHITIITDEDLAAELEDDINALHLANSTELFKTAVNLFKKKYKSKQEKNKQLDEFLAYFDKYWLAQFPGWYLGISEDAPTTNNALESTNRTIKDGATYRELMPL